MMTLEEEIIYRNIVRDIPEYIRYKYIKNQCDYCGKYYRELRKCDICVERICGGCQTIGLCSKCYDVLAGLD